MNPSAIAIIIIVAFFISISIKLAVPVMVVVLNAFVVYSLGLRTFRDIKKGKQYVYLLCGFLSVFILLWFGNLYKHLWPFSSFLILTCVLAWVFDQVKEKYGK